MMFRKLPQPNLVAICTKKSIQKKNKKKSNKKQRVSQMIDQVMTIKTVAGSSKLELSSRGNRPFKVCLFVHRGQFKLHLQKHIRAVVIWKLLQRCCASEWRSLVDLKSDVAPNCQSK